MDRKWNIAGKLFLQFKCSFQDNFSVKTKHVEVFLKPNIISNVLVL